MRSTIADVMLPAAARSGASESSSRLVVCACGHRSRNTAATGSIGTGMAWTRAIRGAVMGRHCSRFARLACFGGLLHRAGNLRAQPVHDGRQLAAVNLVEGDDPVDGTNGLRPVGDDDAGHARGADGAADRL